MALCYEQVEAVGTREGGGTEVGIRLSSRLKASVPALAGVYLRQVKRPTRFLVRSETYSEHSLKGTIVYRFIIPYRARFLITSRI